MSTYQQVVQQARKDLAHTNANDQEIMLLMNDLCRDHGINLYAEYVREADPQIVEWFDQGCKRLAQNEPLDYILGYTEFYGYRFKVDPRVLIPRPETEELVLHALKTIDTVFDGYTSIDVADIGCGSGAIGLSVALEEPRVKLVASDISDDALEVAKINAKALDVDASFYCGDMAKPLMENGIKVDMILCNPPYIPADETMESSVIDYEPHVALFGGSDGLKFYRSVLTDARNILKGAGHLLFEMGYNQKEALSELVQTINPNATVECFKDINRKNRILWVNMHYGNR